MAIPYKEPFQEVLLINEFHLILKSNLSLMKYLQLKELNMYLMTINLFEDNSFHLTLMTAMKI